MNILVAGGAGFLGTYLCRTLLAGHHTVVCLDNFSTGTKSNIAPLQMFPDFNWKYHDIIYPVLPLAFSLPFDIVFNLACPASPIHYQANPLQTLLTSMYGARNLLELARTHEAMFIQASTSEVYGDPSISPQPESYWGNVNPLGPRACYDEGKRCAETLAYLYHEQHSVPVRIARIFNTYGPGMREDDGRVISTFIAQALAGKPLTMFGSGSQTRSFCYVDDLITGLYSLMHTPIDPVQPVNLGSEEEYTIEAVAKIVLELCDSQSEIHTHPLPQDDPQQRKPDCRRAQALLGWKATTSLRTGLKQTITTVRRK